MFFLCQEAASWGRDTLWSVSEAYLGSDCSLLQRAGPWPFPSPVARFGSVASGFPGFAKSKGWRCQRHSKTGPARVHACVEGCAAAPSPRRLWQKAPLSKEAADRSRPPTRWAWDGCSYLGGLGMFTVLGDFACEALSWPGARRGEQGPEWENRAHAGASRSD